MARNTARTGKLKRAKARKGTTPSPAGEASVGELLAALQDESASKDDAGPAAEASEPESAPAPMIADTDDLGLDGYEDRPGDDEPAPEQVPAPEPRADGVELSDTLPMAPEDDISRVRGEAAPRLVSVVESLLFASDRPLTVRDIRRVLKEPTVRQVQLALRHLQTTTVNRGVVLSQVAGGFRLRTNPNNARWVQKMLAGKPARLSRSQLEALAVVAYRQPVTKAELDHIRGVDCGAVLRVLLERDLVRIVGRKEEPGRPHLYGTTVEFLEFFNLRSLRDMPDLHEFRELTEESRATLRVELGEDADEAEAEVLGQEVLQFGADEGDGDPSTETDEAAGDGEGSDGVEGAEAASEESGGDEGAEAASEESSAGEGSEATSEESGADEGAEAASEESGADEGAEAASEESGGDEGAEAASEESGGDEGAEAASEESSEVEGETEP